METWNWETPAPEPSPLVEILQKTLSNPKSGQKHGNYDCVTPMDRLFSQLATSYQTFENKFLRAELAEKILISILIKESNLFRSESEIPQADMEWFDGSNWHPVSIKYKGPNKDGPPSFTSQLSALSWSKNASGSAPKGLTCDMLVIWDADYDPNIRPPKRGAGKANYHRGLCVIPPDQFNPHYVPVAAEKQNKTNSAFKILVCKPALSNPKNWIRNFDNNLVNRIEDPNLRIVFDVR